MTNRFGFLSKLQFLQDSASTLIAGLNPAVVHNLEKYLALKKAHYLSAIENIEGDYLEFGVFTGSSFCHSIRCNQALSKLNPSLRGTRYFGFDSFSGFGEITEDDNHSFYIDENFETSLKKVENRARKVAQDVQFKLIKGYFQSSLQCGASAYGIESSRIIVIDCDTYSSAAEALTFCLPTIQEGTIFVLDDYFSYRGSENKGVARAFAEFIEQGGLSFRHVLYYGMGGAVNIISGRR